MPRSGIDYKLSITEYIFWATAMVIVYTYAGYPLVMTWWKARTVAGGSGQFNIPSVSILVVAHNEASNIAAKVDNLLALDYPLELLEIVIACDGCSDDTAARARRAGRSRIRVLQCYPQRGKAAVLNELIPRLRGDIVVLMDVRQEIEAGAVRALVAGFADPMTGAVGGELVLTQGAGDATTGQGVGFYWHYEKFIRQQESRADSSIGVSGALYALRRDLFQPIPADTILDDVLIPMQVTRQGFRVLFEPRARAYDKVAESASQEFSRKVRTIAGNFQLLVRHPWLLNPSRNRLWLQTLSHKFCRLVCPLCLVVAFICNVLLSGHAFYTVLMILQMLFYGSALVGSLCSRQLSGLISVPYAFCLLNWATVMGFFRFVSGRQQVTWKN